MIEKRSETFFLGDTCFLIRYNKIVKAVVDGFDIFGKASLILYLPDSDTVVKAYCKDAFHHLEDAEKALQKRN